MERRIPTDRLREFELYLERMEWKVSKSKTPRGSEAYDGTTRDGQWACCIHFWNGPQHVEGKGVIFRPGLSAFELSEDLAFRCGRFARAQLYGGSGERKEHEAGAQGK